MRNLEPKVANTLFFELESSVSCCEFSLGPGFADPLAIKRYIGRSEGKHAVTTLRLISVPAQTTIGEIVQLTSGEVLSSLLQTTSRMTEIATTLWIRTFVSLSLPMLILEKDADSQSTECEHAEDNELLRTRNLQLLHVRHREDHNDNVQKEIRSDSAHEPLPIVHTAVRMLNASVPVGRYGDAVQSDRDILFRNISMWYTQSQSKRMSYPCNEPGDHTARHYPNRPSNTRDAEDPAVESQQGQLDKDGGGGIEEILNEEIQQYITHNFVICRWDDLIMNAETEMDPCSNLLLASFLFQGFFGV